MKEEEKKKRKLTPSERAYAKRMFKRHRVKGDLDVDAVVKDIEQRSKRIVKDKSIIRKARRTRLGESK